MTPSEIQQVIANCFSTFEGAKVTKFMKCEQDNSLSMLEKQTLDGNETAEVAGGGSFYLTEVFTLCFAI